ncbi:hypothetical protein F5887DRAFT_1074116 [Amanita rubescens]|nr:hypothetical protein F5887DRAFT_1074116 [Amanita rubescens]
MSDPSSLLPTSSMTIYGNLSQRPDDIPKDVLWTFSDSKADPNVKMTGPNPSHPSMKFALRNRDGSTIEQGIYQLICGSARSIIKSILLPLKPAYFAKGASLAAHFQMNNSTQWTAAILQLERQHPLVALCAEHWKAKHLLQAALRYKNKKKGGGGDGGGDDDDDMGEEDESDNGGDGGQSNKRPRALSGGQSAEKRPRMTKASGLPTLLNDKASPLEMFAPVVPQKKPTSYKQTTPSSSQRGNSGVTSPPSEAALRDKDDTEDSGGQTREDGGAGIIDTSYIQVSATHDNLLRIFNTTYSECKSGMYLLVSLHDSPPSGSPPSEMVKGFLQVLETANPNSGSFDEDNMGTNWGHAQFSNRWSRVLQTWEDVGSPEVARRLIAAMIKTAQRNEKGKGKATADTDSADLRAGTQAATPSTQATTAGTNASTKTVEPAVGDVEGQSNENYDALELILKPLNKTDICSLIKSHKLGTYKSNPKRIDLTSLVQSALNEKTPADLDALIAGMRKTAESASTVLWSGVDL